MTTLMTTMRTGALAAIVTLLFGAPGALAAEGVDQSYLHSPYHLSKYDKVFYSFNGRVWTHLPIEEKALYLEGMKAGMALLVNMASTGGPDKTVYDAFERTVFTRFDSLELSRQIDVIYKDRNNLNIPIGNAYILAGSKLSGRSSDKEYDDLLAELRKTYIR